LSSQPTLFDRVDVVTLQPLASLELGPDDSADWVFTFRNNHDGLSAGFASELIAAVFRVLMPGGVYEREHFLLRDITFPFGSRTIQSADSLDTHVTR
jgi:predicted methyltransferase